MIRFRTNVSLGAHGQCDLAYEFAIDSFQADELRLPKTPPGLMDLTALVELERCLKRRELFVQSLASQFAREFTDAFEKLL